MLAAYGLAFAVITDRLYRTGIERLAAKLLFIGGFRLLIDERIAVLVVAGKVGRCGVAANVTVDALLIDVKAAGDIVGKFVFGLCHLN